MSRALRTYGLALLSVAAGAGLWASALAAGEVPFGPQQTISGAADGGRSVVAADVDGDGDLDVFSASSLDDKIAWHENTAGDGSAWTPHTISTLADAALSVFAADVDGDGDVDVLSASAADDKIAWYANDGAGGFGAQQVISTAADNARSVVAADVDKDGDLDALSASLDDDTIAWYENTAGDGSAWTTHTISTVADGAISVFAADVDGDGDPDALSASKLDDTIAWYPGNGAGGFGAQSVISTTALGAQSVFAADVDGDGDLDAISASADDDTIAWYENTAGNGTAWTPHTVSTSADDARSVAAADVDGDGDLDVLSASAGDNKIAWYENTAGDGTAWTPRTISTAAATAVWVTTADVDGDGDLDALSASFDDDRIAWYENETIHHSATFSGERVITGGGGAVFANSVFAADIDGNGVVDVLSASRGDDKIAWYENTAGDGSAWTAHTISTLADFALSVFAADLDGDGDADVLSASLLDDKIAWYENDGAGGFGAQQVISTFADGARAVIAADVDGDGDLDALSASADDDKIAWYENLAGDGSTWTTRIISTATDQALSVFADDVDGDGDLDVLSASSADKVAWYENTAGDGSAWAEHTISVAAGGASSVVAADVDGDGDLDALSASAGDSKIAWYENTAGDGSAWSAHTISTTAAGDGSVFAVDVDRDGDLDALSASSFDDRIAWYENTAGDGSAWTPHTISTAADSARAVFAADIDRDGDLDALSASADDSKIAWYENHRGQFALPTTDVAQLLVANGEVHDLLEITLLHRGRAGDSAVELASLELRLTDGAGAALAEAEALGLIQELRLYLDDGSGAFDAADPLIDSLSDFSSITANGNGALTWTLPDDIPALQVAFGAPKTYYLVGEMTAGAESAAPGTFAVEHLTESSSTGEYASLDLPLALEPADIVGTGKIGTSLSSATCQAPFDLHLDHRTVAVTVTCEAGTVLTAGDSFVVVSPGNLTFRAGQEIRLEAGFEVQGGSFTAEENP